MFSNILKTFYFSELKQTRLALLQHLPDPHHDTQKIELALKTYLTVLRGFFEQPDNKKNDATDDSQAAGVTRQGNAAAAEEPFDDHGVHKVEQ